MIPSRIVATARVTSNAVTSRPLIVSPATEKQKGQSEDWPFCLVPLARPERFERPTPWFVAKYSIQLSYGRLALFEGGIIPARFKLLKYYLQCCRNAPLVQGASLVQASGCRCAVRRSAGGWLLGLGFFEQDE